MRTQFLKLLPLTFVIAAVIFGLTGINLATAAPPDTPPAVLNHIAQASGVTLQKTAGAENVHLGQVVSYTVTIKNESGNTINATLTDALPKGLLALQRHPISATIGTVEITDNTLTWSGSVANGEQATITYDAIPPSLSTAGQMVKNAATLQFGETKLEAGATITTQATDAGIWGTFVNFLALILVWTDNLLRQVGVPYSFGFAIILFTLAVRLITYPLNVQQIKSSKAMQELQPKMKEMQEKYKNDKEKLAQEQMALYKEHGVNPLGGCLPMLVQMPVWFALYQALMKLSVEGLLNEGFLWIPSLAGPVSAGGGLSWLWPLPPAIGWGSAVAYLVLPVLLVVSQLYMQQMMSPPSTDPQQSAMQSTMKLMPLMFGYFALVVPSGLTLYWFTSNLLQMAQQFFTQRQTITPATTGGSTKIPATATAQPTAPASGRSDLANPGGDVQSQNDKKQKRKRRRK